MWENEASKQKLKGVGVKTKQFYYMQLALQQVHIKIKRTFFYNTF